LVFTPDSPACLLSEAASFLARHGIPTPRLDAEVLLAHTLGMSKTGLYTRLHIPLDTPHHTAFWQKIQQRAGREPLQYITRVQEFWSLDFLVDQRVLIPRPETELVVEVGLELLGGPSAAAEQSTQILDLGTGSGCIVIALATQLPRAQFWAYDVSSDALAVARENARRHRVDDRVTFIHADMHDGLAARLSNFDLIVTNPPYIAQSELSALQPEVRAWEPRLALDGGRDGLDFYRRLLQDCPMLLRLGGWLVMEIGQDQSETVLRMAEAQPTLTDRCVWRDYAGLPRVVSAQRAQRQEKSRSA
jgi:release factor glutamine methyltransferase